MPTALIWAVAVVAALGGLASYLIALHQLSDRFAPAEARRRALAAVPGPMAFYAVVGVVVAVATPVVLPH
ncbi:MAG TPA: hypothetical protein VHL53_04740 [Acidimicrobiia bacterium]|nr:hypothetical protein [Acidimicrobiia bacterium]